MLALLEKSQESSLTDLRAQNDLKIAGRGWELQSSITVNRQSITSVIESGGFLNGGFQGGGTPGPTATASSDYLAIEPDAQSPGKTAEEVRAEDIADLFVGMAGTSVRVTRMRSDLAKTAMNVDFHLYASSAQPASRSRSRAHGAGGRPARSETAIHSHLGGMKSVGSVTTSMRSRPSAISRSPSAPRGTTSRAATSKVPGTASPMHETSIGS